MFSPRLSVGRLVLGLVGQLVCTIWIYLIWYGIGLDWIKRAVGLGGGILSTECLSSIAWPTVQDVWLHPALKVSALVNVSSVFTLFTLSPLVNNHSEPLKSDRSADDVSGWRQVSRQSSSADLRDTDGEKLQVSGQWLMDLWPTSVECFQPAGLFLYLWPSFHKQAEIQMWWRNSESLQLLF